MVFGGYAFGGHIMADEYNGTTYSEVTDIFPQLIMVARWNTLTVGLIAGGNQSGSTYKIYHTHMTVHLGHQPDLFSI